MLECRHFLTFYGHDFSKYTHGYRVKNKRSVRKTPDSLRQQNRDSKRNCPIDFSHLLPPPLRLFFLSRIAEAKREKRGAGGIQWTSQPIDKRLIAGGTERRANNSDESGACFLWCSPVGITRVSCLQSRSKVRTYRNLRPSAVSDFLLAACRRSRSSPLRNIHRAVFLHAVTDSCSISRYSVRTITLQP